MEASPVSDQRQPEVLTYGAYMREQAASEGPSPRLVNRQPEHAAILIELLFQAARDHVHILSRQLDDAIYDSPDAVDAAVSFLAAYPTACIEIAVEDPRDVRGRRLINAIQATPFRDRLRLYSVPADVQRAYPFNFIVVDGKHYRFEQERESVEAIVQFGNAAVGEALEGIFRSVKASSLPM